MGIFTQEKKTCVKSWRSGYTVCVEWLSCAHRWCKGSRSLSHPESGSLRGRRIDFVRRSLRPPPRSCVHRCRAQIGETDQQNSVKCRGIWVFTLRSVPVRSVTLELYVLRYFPVLPILYSQPPAHTWMYYRFYWWVFYPPCAHSHKHCLLSYVPFLFKTPVNGTAFILTRPQGWKGWCKRRRMLGFC